MQSDGTELAVFIDRFASWTEYLHEMAQDGKWGDHVILFAAANCYECDIHVISSVPSHDCIVRPDPPISDAAQLVLGHVVEEHYVSLKPSLSGNHNITITAMMIIYYILVVIIDSKVRSVD